MSRMTEEEVALDTLERLKALPGLRLDKLVEAFQQSVQNMFQEYLDEAGTESDGFIEGLDITFAQAVEFVNDVLRYSNGGADPKYPVKNPTIK